MSEDGTPAAQPDRLEANSLPMLPKLQGQEARQTQIAKMLRRPAPARSSCRSRGTGQEQVRDPGGCTGSDDWLLIMALTSVIMTTMDVILKRRECALMIQITVFLEILISCIPRLEVVWLSQWANQPDRTPRNRSPSGWRTEGKSARLAKGMPNVSPTGLKGGPIQQRVERNAENFGLDEEMLRATERILDRLGSISQTSKNGNAGSDITRRPGLLPAHDRLVTDRFAAEAQKTKRHRLGCLER